MFEVNNKDTSTLYQVFGLLIVDIPTGNYLFKVNNRMTRTRC